MQFRRNLMFIVTGLFLFAGMASVLSLTREASAEVKLAMPKRSLLRRPSLHTDLIGTDPDSVWIGHVNTPTGLPGLAGGYGPYHIGRGLNRITGGGKPSTPASSFNGTWSFEHFVSGETDSLFGWWPIKLPYGSVGGSNKPDYQRSFFGFDHGNQGNYVINQGAPKRTFGVTGYWHRDPGNNVPGLPDTGAVIAGPDVEWAPLGGTASAWCGLRAHGDLTARDEVTRGGTGNYFNQDVLDYNGNNTTLQVGSNSTLGTDKNFPGYGHQWDQMLYRDVALADNASLNISFKYRTAMSQDKDGASNTRVGWFDKDPLSAAQDGSGNATSDGNFISSSNAGADGPVDSFMVYIGVPVEPVAGADNDFTASDGIQRDIYDVQRRWFSEVIAIDKPYREILTKSGVNNTTATINIAGGVGTIVQQILDAQPGAGGNVRLAFRVKTNRGYSDEDFGEVGFSSGTAGAAIVDDVVVNGWAAANGDFEAVGSINNDPGVTLALAAWKSTGKPPGVYFHAHSIMPGFGLPYDDPCGVLGGASRACNMTGVIISPGNHDLGEKPGGIYGQNAQDRQDWFASPTINLMSTGPGAYNDMGIDSDIAASTEYAVVFDLYSNLLQFGSTANGLRCGWQSYPGLQANGAKCWAEVGKTIFFSAYDGTTGCNPADDPAALSPGGAFARFDGVIFTSNANGIPDSLRAYIEHLTICYRRPVTGATCSPSSGPNAGLYLDNISIGLLNTPPPPAIAFSVWDIFNDAFPTNSSNAFPGSPQFDTLAAQVRSGYNTGRQTGDLTRTCIPGDTALVKADGANVRMDLVFRILPGVGNYLQVGNRASGVRKRPDGGGLIGNKATAGDGSFWGEYMADNGAFGTGGNGTAGPGHPGGVWDPNRWNSARMDTVENNIFPANDNNPNLSLLSPGIYGTMYHEAEPKYPTLGVAKNRCFLINPASGQSTNADNITCGAGTYPPAWANAAAGFNPNEIIGQPGKTKEYTKIIPDGQLTPGGHIEYFFRRQNLPNPITTFDMMPDTFAIYPQLSAGPDFDGKRWFTMNVLPDRWKDPAFGAGGTGMASMLVWNLGHRRGDMLTWVSMADSIGLTTPAKYGAHNGWHARGDQDIQLGVNPASTPAGDPTMAVRANLGQPGSTWDLFQVVAGESNVPAGRLGSRSAATAVGLEAGKGATAGPTGLMLRTYYRSLVLLATDLGNSSIGPIADQSDDDIGLLIDFMTNPAPGGTPRGFLAMGRDLVEGQADAVTGHPTFFPTYFGANLVVPDYRLSAGNSNDVVDLTPTGPTNPTGGIYGVNSPCFYKNDVLDRNVVVTGSTISATWPVVGSLSAYGASVYTPESGTARIVRTLVEGWTFGAFGGMGSRFTVTPGGNRHHMLQIMSNMFGALGSGPIATPVGVGDMPGTPGSLFVNFMNLRSSNPMRDKAQIAFGLVKTEKVEIKVYDVTGRLVKTVANRTFQGGLEHVVTWDGTSDAGQSVAPGVYFYQLRSPSFVSQKKLAVLRN